MSTDKLSDEDFGPGFEAVFKVIDGGQECTCEFVNIGVGYQKVAETPDCPRCTSFGMTMTILAALAGRILPAGGEERTEKGWQSDGEVHRHLAYGVNGLPYRSPDRQRTVTKWPDGSELVGPWVDVTGVEP